MTLQTAISYFFYGMASISVFCFLLLTMLYWKRERNESERLRKTRADIGDITIIFQTMRDIVDQQKTLAREFNEGLDKKMAVVKQVLGQSLSRNEELYERQRALAEEIEHVEARLESAQRQLAGLDVDRKSAAASGPADSRALGDRFGHTSANARNSRPSDGQAEEDEQEAPLLFGVKGALELDDDLTEAPDEPADPDRARQAFRALLDMDAAPRTPDDAFARSARQSAPSAPVADKKENSDDMTPLQKRVEEYSASGMTVSEIARELGIGKGEVRLMLSLKRSS